MMILSIIYSLLLAQFIPMVMVILVIIAAVVMIIMNRLVKRRVLRSVNSTLDIHDMMEKTLKISASNVIIYDVHKGIVSQLSGYMLSKGDINVETYKQHVHPDDLDTVLENIRSLIRGEGTSVEFDYRWNFNFDEGAPQWGYLHNTSVAEYVDGVPQPVTIISALVDQTNLYEQQEQETALSKRYKQIFENSIIGLSFYSADGWLIDANRQMRVICNFDSDEGDSYFSNTNLFDVAPFNEVLDRNNLEDYWACSLSVVPERNMYVYLEIRVHPILDSLGHVVYLAVAARDISEERKLYLQQKLNDEQIQKAKEAIQLYETELRYMMEGCKMEAWRAIIEEDRIEFYSGLSTIVRSITMNEMREIFVNKDDEFVRSLSDLYKALDHPLVYVGQICPRHSESINGPLWVQINSIPEYDDKGHLKGSFGIWRNINDIMHKQELLKRETERAKDSGHQKSVFLANMTHEIRTPLNAIVGFSDLLQAVESPEEKHEMIRIIHNNCDMLLRLINDILVLSNVDANAMQIRPEMVDFAIEFNDICKSLSERVQEPSVEFQSDNPCDTLLVSIDKSRIQQVITNFVTNAVKYTHQGHIRVGYRLEEREGKQGLYVYCEDTGAGIPDDQLGRVFERFVKLNDYIQGTGLGLSICKAIVDRCNGDIGVESKFGEGSTFWFWIPV
ncbi:ATP-binding protein [Prevotella sp. tc2-28]|uniref:PAS domain-containing sensor histidine kinase n=1 Tax=Prevotella sp. tc2-28 TaxID=1761888 RepID=UPI000B85A94E|nr:ATP-binding protein [Prevotella sp. tc2-28]